MNDDPIALLERELVKAARRQAHSRGSRRPFGPGRIVGGLATASRISAPAVMASATAADRRGCSGRQAVLSTAARRQST